MSAAEPEACALSSSSLDVEEKCQYYGNSSSDPPTEPHPDMDMFCCHSVQDSLLSSDSRFTNYRGILNWIIILLMSHSLWILNVILLNVIKFYTLCREREETNIVVFCVLFFQILTHAHLFLDNFIQHGFLIDLRKVLEHLMEDHYNWPSVNLILAANMFAIAALLLERCLDKGTLSPSAGHCLHLGNLGLLTLFPAVIILYDTSISTGGAYFSLWTYTVLGLKLYSYQETNSWYRQGSVPSPGTDKCVLHETKKHIEHLPIKDLYYFLLAPTLCYQRNFPFTPRVRINVLCKTLIEMVVLTQIIVGVVQQWIEPIFQRSENSFSNMDITTRVEHLMELVAPNHFLWLMFSFLFSHSYLNFCAELLCFGDRHFYGDWWNAKTLKCFWGNWNIPLHKWRYRHLYTPLLKKRVSQKQADLLVFLMSAALCEYVIALPLHSCRLWIFFMMIFELLVDVYLGDYFKGNYGNGLVWLCFLLGPPLAMMTYFHDHYMSHHGQHPPGLSVAECLS